MSNLDCNKDNEATSGVLRLPVLHAMMCNEFFKGSLISSPAEKMKAPQVWVVGCQQGSSLLAGASPHLAPPDVSTILNKFNKDSESYEADGLRNSGGGVGPGGMPAGPVGRG